MKYVEYEEFVMGLAKSGEEIAKEISPHGAHLLHMAVGIAGEAGELLDAIKKVVIYNKTIDLHNVVEELGDLEFYMAGLRHELRITREEVIQHNMDKLSTRYQNGYSDNAAQERADKNGSE